MATTKTKEQRAVEDVEEFFEGQEGGTQAEEFELPPGYEGQSVGFARAYAHARKHGNQDKASLLFAEAHGWSFEETEDV